MFFGGSPFDHFEQQARASRGRGGGGGRSRASAGVDTTKLYETLGVSITPVCSGLFVVCRGVGGSPRNQSVTPIRIRRTEDSRSHWHLPGPASGFSFFFVVLDGSGGIAAWR